MLIVTKENNSVNTACRVIVLVCANCLIIYICTKFRANILNGLRVMERT